MKLKPRKQSVLASIGRVVDLFGTADVLEVETNPEHKARKRVEVGSTESELRKSFEIVGDDIRSAAEDFKRNCG